MVNISENISLKPFNTFRIDAKARYFSTFSTIEDLIEQLEYSKRRMRNPKLFILGGGSNILFTKDYKGLVLKNEIGGIEEEHEDKEYIYLKVGAGENWHHFVMYCLEKDWAGLENLSLIPGNVGASPMQNIGAYGVELQEVFLSLEALNLREKKIYTFTPSDCAFGYRDSVFKNKYKDQFVILNVTFRLNKKPRFHTGYGAVQDELERMGVKELTIKAVSDAVIHIRTSKLPDPAIIGNAGSFFKNPSVTKEKFELLKSKFEDIVVYKNLDGTYKLAAGWLIEKCGWKGYRKGDTGCHEKQALVLVNYGNAKGKEVFDLSQKIMRSVKKMFAVTLDREVNII